MTITIEELAEILKSASIITPENSDEPIYIRFSKKELSNAETVTYNTPDGSIIAIDLDDSNNIYGVEIW